MVKAEIMKDTPTRRRGKLPQGRRAGRSREGGPACEVRTLLLCLPQAAAELLRGLRRAIPDEPPQFLSAGSRRTRASPETFSLMTPLTSTKFVHRSSGGSKAPI